MAVETSYEKEYKKKREKERKKIEALKKKYPDNSVIAEMGDDVQEEKLSEDRSKMDHFSLIHKAIWNAEELYSREGHDYKKVTNDLIEVIKSCQEEYSKEDSA